MIDWMIVFIVVGLNMGVYIIVTSFCDCFRRETTPYELALIITDYDAIGQFFAENHDLLLVASEIDELVSFVRDNSEVK